jgi:hypothetical protein
MNEQPYSQAHYDERLQSAREELSQSSRSWIERVLHQSKVMGNGFADQVKNPSAERVASLQHEMDKRSHDACLAWVHAAHERLAVLDVIEALAQGRAAGTSVLDGPVQAEQGGRLLTS